MMDGWLARFRGEGWGQEVTEKKRWEWHEIKNGLFYRIEQAGRTAGDRGVISEKVLVRWQGPPLELGRRLHWEALRAGLGRGQGGRGGGRWHRVDLEPGRRPLGRSHSNA